MPQEELIQNGDFEDGKANWSGTDVEVNREHRYIDGDSSNRVAEVDGNKSQITVMEQTITVDSATTTALTLDAALRDAALPQAGSDGFEVEVLDSSGSVVAAMTVLPDDNTYDQFSLPVTFGAPGDYTVRFTEVGNNDSLGAIVDNISLLVCFAAGTRIDVPGGSTAVEHLKVGDVVTTKTGPQVIRWIGRRELNSIDLQKNPKFYPVRIMSGALGPGLPHQDLLVSRQHRMQVTTKVCERMFGARDVLVAAHRLTELPGIYVDHEIANVTYYHILFDAHEVVFANGAPSESLLAGPEALRSLNTAAVEEIFGLFPELRDDSFAIAPALPVPKGHRQTRLVHRLQKNDQCPLQL
ncbi:MAG: Hint domain-containing protein [Pseudomonadota bacterium]